jgi:predicted nucleic acid-binding protein
MNKPGVYLDSCCFIDMVAFEINKHNKDREDDIWFYRKLVEASKDDKIQIYTSYLTLSECLCVNVNDESILNDDTKKLINSLLLSGKSGIMPISPSLSIIKLSRALRWDYDIRLKPFDSLHIASALESKCSEFVTTDQNTIDKNGNIAKIENLGLKVIRASGTKILPPEYRIKDIQEELFEGKSNE